MSRNQPLLLPDLLLPKASRAQMRMLHLLSQGKLVFRGLPVQGFEVLTQSTDDSPNQSWQFHQVTARILVDRGWVELKGFNPRRGEYRLTAAGRELIDQLCKCETPRGRRKGLRFDEELESLAGQLLCRHCGRCVPCVSRKAMQHAGTRAHWKYGVVCDEHWKRASERRRA